MKDAEMKKDRENSARTSDSGEKDTAVYAVEYFCSDRPQPCDCRWCGIEARHRAL